MKDVCLNTVAILFLLGLRTSHFDTTRKEAETRVTGRHPPWRPILLKFPNHLESFSPPSHHAASCSQVRAALGWGIRVSHLVARRRASGNRPGALHAKPSSVTKNVCSNCADFDPSAVTAVQSSGQVRSRHPPRLIIGSIVKMWPAFITPTALFLL